MRVGFVLFPGFTGLDLVAPHEVLVRAPTECLLVAETLAMIYSDRGLKLEPDVTFDECPPLDLLFVPGGPGQTSAMDNPNLIGFLVKRASQAKVVASVCTGTLLLAQAGIAKGRRASTHWLAKEELARLGAIPVNQRVVRDGNLYTAAGVTSGLDLALVLVEDLFGTREAQRITLQIEYDPQPPHDVGSPGKASQELVDLLKSTSRFHQVR
jgi:cyclohexyl-isocyanide hydratase